MLSLKETQNVSAVPNPLSFFDFSLYLWKGEFYRLGLFGRATGNVRNQVTKIGRQGNVAYGDDPWEVA